MGKGPGKSSANLKIIIIMTIIIAQGKQNVRAVWPGFNFLCLRSVFFTTANF